MDMLKKTLERNLLKYSAGRAICCPRCNQVADYRSWVIWDSPAGQTGANCADCWRLALAKVHDDKPHSYLLSVGWQVNTLVDFEKKPRAKPVNTLKTQAQRTKDVFNSMKRMGRITKHDRLFPSTLDCYRPSKLIDTVTPDGFDSSYDSIPVTSPLLTAEYVREFCRLNHLTGGAV